MNEFNVILAIVLLFGLLLGNSWYGVIKMEGDKNGGENMSLKDSRWMLSSCWDGCVYSDWYVKGVKNRSGSTALYRACSDLCLDRSEKGTVLNRSEVMTVLEKYRETETEEKG